MQIKFTVLGDPQGKGRPRFSKVGGFVKARTPDETVLYENLIRTEYSRQCGDFRFPDGTELDLRVIAYYGIPASASKKRQRMMENGEIRPTKKPDADNILKVVADSLNNRAYHDDAQVVDTQTRKWYARLPRIDVFLQLAKKRGEVT